MSGARTTRLVAWQDDRAKARWLDGACWIDARLPEVRQAALTIAGDGDPYERAARIVRWVRDQVSYTRDQWSTGELGERIADAGVTLGERFEDCDGKARLVVALCRALDEPEIRARIVAVMQPDGYFSHAAADVWTGDDWHRAETIVDGAELGYDARFRALEDGTMPIV